ncbi:MAG: aminotransferase class IV [Flavobacteriaceae bacterium]|nr:aminotransferase class IV [Flavobacteriaceae bacterium]
MSSRKRKEEKAASDQPEIKCWSNGEMIEGHKMVSSLTAGFHYSLAVWEGIRAYNGKPFRLKDHVQRLYRSAQMLEMPILFPQREVYNAILELVKQFDPELDLYIRPIAYLSNTEKDYFDKKTMNLDIYVFPIKHDSSKQVRLYTSNFRRSFPYFNMQIKIPANYWMINSAKAQFPDADGVLFLDKDGYVVESGVANLFIFKGSELITPPADGSILPGITRQTIMDEVYPTTERKITLQDIYEASGAFLCGTYTEIQRISHVDGFKIGADDFKMVDTIRNRYLEIVKGGN